MLRTFVVARFTGIFILLYSFLTVAGVSAFEHSDCNEIQVSSSHSLHCQEASTEDAHSQSSHQSCSHCHATSCCAVLVPNALVSLSNNELSANRFERETVLIVRSQRPLTPPPNS